jgi:hypothetical protein
VITKKLAESFFMIGDAMFPDQRQEIVRSETRQRRFGEVRIGGVKVFGCGVSVGEIAATTPGDQNFFADTVGVFDERNSAAAFARFRSTEEASGAGAEDENVEGMGQKYLAIKRDRD